MRSTEKVTAAKNASGRRTGLTAWVIALVSAVAINIGPVMGDTLRIHGSTTFDRAIMEPFQKDIERLSKHRLKVVPNKSANGIIDLLTGRADMAMISASMEAVLAKVTKLRPKLNSGGLLAHLIAETHVAFVVHPDNPVRQMTRADLAKILKGDISNWRELGGADMPILTAYVRTTGGVTHAVQEVVLKGKEMSPTKSAAMDSPVQVAKIVAQERSAIGLAQLRLATEYKLVQLSVGEPVAQLLSLITIGKPKPAAEAVIRAARNVAERLELPN